jgi:hypothetical protein
MSEATKKERATIGSVLYRVKVVVDVGRWLLKGVANLGVSHEYIKVFNVIL